MKPQPRQPRRSQPKSRLTIVLLIVYILLLVSIILFKLPFYSPTLVDARELNLLPLLGSFDENGVLVWREIAYNILIFIPMGIYLCMFRAKWSFLKKLIPIIATSLAFEIVQFIFAIGRSDITDLLGNTLGGLIGIAIYVVLRKALKDKTNRIVNILALVATVCVVLYFGYLFYLSHLMQR